MSNILGVRERQTGYALDVLRQDLTCGLRMMTHKPGFYLRVTVAWSK